MKIEVNYIEDTVWITDFRECKCDHVGKDDGETTCWKHHICSWGGCTHQENGDEPEDYMGEDYSWPSQED